MDKLHFSSFIFAVLLSLTVHFIALRVGRAIMHQHNKIILKSFGDMIFPIIHMAISHHVEFLKDKILFEEGSVWQLRQCAFLI